MRQCGFSTVRRDGEVIVVISGRVSEGDWRGRRASLRGRDGEEDCTSLEKWI